MRESIFLVTLYPIEQSLKDQASFEVLFRKLYTPLCKTIFKIVHDKEVAEDIAQDAFIVLWEKRAEVNVSVKSYLYRAAINKSFNYLERNKRWVRAPEDDWFEWAPAANTTELTMGLAETQNEINKAIESLPPACRSIFLMSRTDEMSYKEIADALEISIKTVENQMSKALKILREKLSVLAILSLVFIEILKKI